MCVLSNEMFKTIGNGSKYPSIAIYLHCSLYFQAYLQRNSLFLPIGKKNQNVIFHYFAFVNRNKIAKQRKFQNGLLFVWMMHKNIHNTTQPNHVL